MPEHKIRTTMTPHEEIVVSSAELRDLENLGVVLKTNASTEAGLQKAAIKQTEATKDS